MKSMVCGLLVSAVALSLAGCGGGSGASSPQGAFDKFTSSMQKKDYETAMAQVTPESQDMLLAVMAMGASFMAIDPAIGGEAKALLEKHGMKDDPGADAKNPFAGVKNKPAAIGELMVFMEKNSKGKGGPAPGAEMADAKLEDVKISGNTADGTIAIKKDGVDQKKPAKFKKVGEVWLIDFAADAGMPPGGPPPGLGGPGGQLNLQPLQPDGK